jgi:dipeptidase D
LDIGKNLGNANKIIFRFLQKAQAFDVRLVSVDAGNGRNVIPREAFATVVVAKENVAKFNALVEEFTDTTKSELEVTEPDFQFLVEATKADQVMKSDDQQKLVNLVCSLPNGVMRMSDIMPGLVETSNNLATVKSENGEIKIICMLRSSVVSAKESLGDMIVAIGELAGVNVELSGNYNGWNFNLESPILHVMKDVFKTKFGTDPQVIARHSGLECGIFTASYPNLDIIAFGPDIRHLHSPDEKVNIASVAKFWDLLVATLANVK